MSFPINEGRSLSQVLGGDQQLLTQLSNQADTLLAESQDAADYYSRLAAVDDERIFIFAGRSFYVNRQSRFGPVDFIKQFMPFETLTTKLAQHTDMMSPEATAYDALKAVLSESDDVTRRMMLLVVGINAAVQVYGDE